MASSPLLGHGIDPKRRQGHSLRNRLGRMNYPGKPFGEASREIFMNNNEVASTWDLLSRIRHEPLPVMNHAWMRKVHKSPEFIIASLVWIVESVCLHFFSVSMPKSFQMEPLWLLDTFTTVIARA
jgi:hypothetical protein